MQDGAGRPHLPVPLTSLPASHSYGWLKHWQNMAALLSVLIGRPRSSSLLQDRPTRDRRPVTDTGFPESGRAHAYAPVSNAWRHTLTKIQKEKSTKLHGGTDKYGTFGRAMFVYRLLLHADATSTLPWRWQCDIESKHLPLYDHNNLYGVNFQKIPLLIYWLSTRFLTAFFREATSSFTIN